MNERTQQACIIAALLALAAVIAVILWHHDPAQGWEGDDGGLDQREVEIGRWAAAVTAQAARGTQLELTTPPAPPTTLEPVPSWPWDALAQCESGGDWQINTGNGFYGGLQFTLQSWRGVGGTGYPHHASREEQIRRGIKLQQLQGWGAWPACSRKLGLR